MRKTAFSAVGVGAHSSDCCGMRLYPKQYPTNSLEIQSTLAPQIIQQSFVLVYCGARMNACFERVLPLLLGTCLFFFLCLTGFQNMNPDMKLTAKAL